MSSTRPRPLPEPIMLRPQAVTPTKQVTEDAISAAYTRGAFDGAAFAFMGIVVAVAVLLALGGRW